MKRVQPTHSIKCLSLRSSSDGPSVFPKLLAMVLVAAAAWIPSALNAQISRVVLSEDFESGAIDPLKLVPDSPFFEGGIGDISASVVADEEIGSNVVEFTGAVSQQWWAGATLRVVPTFTASVETNIVVSVDRVKESGVGTASRSALWIMNAAQTRFVLFAQNRNENNWQYNRNIGEAAGDSPTGGGSAIAAFNAAGSPFLDGGLHTMKAVANGSTVSLYLDDVFGAEVKFPFRDLVIHIGSYARATGDAASTRFDNLSVAEVGSATFSTTTITLEAGQTSAGNVTVRIPSGANAAGDVVLRVVSSNPAVAIPVGAVNGVLTLAFAQGASNEKTIDIQASGAVGGSVFTLENDIDLRAGNSLAITAIEGPGVRLTDDFSGSEVDAAKWAQNDSGFEVGVGSFSVSQPDGTLTISGNLDQSQYWGGASLKTVASYTATKDLALVVNVDRVSIVRTKDDATDSTAVRTGVYLTSNDRSRFLFFGQNLGETGWEVNLNPGNPTGSGTAIPAFNAMNDNGQHAIKLVANGQSVDVFLDGVFGGSFPFVLSAGIHVELGAYARALADQVTGSFDNLRIENTLPCISVTPPEIVAVAGDAPKPITITIPKLLNSTGAATVTVTSSDASVVSPEGSDTGTLAVNFAGGSAVTKAVNLTIRGVGSATITLSNPDTCVSQQVLVSVTPALATLLTDSFSSETIDESVWRIETMPLSATGVLSDNSIAISTEGELRIGVTNAGGAWPGYTLFTRTTYSAGANAPVTFEIDRVKLDKVLVTGTSAKQRTALWVSDEARLNFVFFSEFKTWDGSVGGWDYTVVRDSEDGFLNQDLAGTAIPAFVPAQFNDSGNHRLKAVANGATVKLYLDDVFGVEVPFALTGGIVFGFGAYVQAATDVVYGNFDNAKVLGVLPGLGPLAASRLVSGDVQITWQGNGVLQSSPALGNGANWVDVTPAPANNTLTLSRGALAAQAFYRLRP